MKHVLFLLRSIVLVWSLVMITASDWESITSRGDVELEYVNRSAYAQIGMVVLASFLADTALERKKDK